MQAGVAIKHPVHTIDGIPRFGRPGLIERIREVMAVCARASAAAHFYAEHKRLSDAGLADRGLRRADLPRATFERLAGES